MVIMNKLWLVLEIDVDKDIFLHRLIELPFVPMTGMNLVLKGTFEDANTTILDEVVILDCEYYLQSNEWEARVGMCFGTIKQRTLLKILMNNGWEKSR